MSLSARILIIEDEEILAENLRDFLLRRAALVHLVCRPALAITDAADFQPEIVIVDYSLPDMNGLEAFSRLKRGNPALRGILITGHPTDTVRGAARDVGIDCVLTKPFPFSELDSALRSLDRPASTGGPAIEAASAPPRIERRNPDSAPTFPLVTATGWVMHDRRRGNHPGSADVRTMGSAPLHVTAH